ncbi:type II secretion system protein [Pontiella sulfatireligans]|nr:prepilin-type N-terminal cleavage/methylation domain-containing protein [Pontiella sulfatireligans]
MQGKNRAENQQSQGFTLVEVMIGVAVIELLASIGIPSFSKAREGTATNTCRNNLSQMGTACCYNGLNEPAACESGIASHTLQP